jgi:S-adenosylmethionine hydrolase
MRKIITLTTDFGLNDPYVAAMKGVILNICRNADIIDLSHNIEQYNTFKCAKFLSDSIPFFPYGSVHVIVVDPGVGSERSPAAVYMDNKYFVCPDNGVLSFLTGENKNYKAFRITNSEYCMPDISSTFHGRDIFAPAAAHLANGLDIGKLGEEIPELRTFKIKKPVFEDDGRITGEIVYIDIFGNCISNIRKFNTDNIGKIEINGKIITKITNSYSGLENNVPGIIVGSSGFFEVSVNKGNADKLLGIRIGDKLYIYPS